MKVLELFTYILVLVMDFRLCTLSEYMPETCRQIRRSVRLGHQWRVVQTWMTMVTLIL